MRKNCKYDLRIETFWMAHHRTPDRRDGLDFLARDLNSDWKLNYVIRASANVKKRETVLNKMYLMENEYQLLETRPRFT